MRYQQATAEVRSGLSAWLVFMVDSTLQGVHCRLRGGLHRCSVLLFWSVQRVTQGHISGSLFLHELTIIRTVLQFLYKIHPTIHINIVTWGVGVGGVGHMTYMLCRL